GVAVLYLTRVYGSVPRVALTLAVTFSLYGAVKKAAPLGSFHGLALETAILFLPGLAYLAFQARSGHAAFLHLSPAGLALLLCCGAVTTLPLVLFAAAAQRVPLAQIGILQYIAPTLQFLLGALLFREPLTAAQLGGFALVWIALALLGVEGALTYRNARRLSNDTPV
ncbi:MAG TPA: EamA family transporter, partial [Chthonomonadaceae bacterium]|nr:EamA family transporter [Chthonomonadaceae bacterium]